MLVRIVSPGWETFTGSMGHRAMFKDGLSLEPLNERQIARIGSSVKIINEETGEQLGPSAALAKINTVAMPISAPLKTKAENDAVAEVERERLVAEEEARKVEQKAALEAARAKAADEIVVYSRTELEAIGSNDGVYGLREIANPLGVKGRSITELVTAILEAQAKRAAA